MTRLFFIGFEKLGFGTQWSEFEVTDGVCVADDDKISPAVVQAVALIWSVLVNLPGFAKEPTEEGFLYVSVEIDYNTNRPYVAVGTDKSTYVIGAADNMFERRLRLMQPNMLEWIELMSMSVEEAERATGYIAEPNQGWVTGELRVATWCVPCTHL